ncbi:MAG: endonuclease NucS [bacterium]|nr:endonuclease NucS [bacterium]
MYRFSEKQIEGVIIENLDLIDSKLKFFASQFNIGHDGCKTQTCETGHHEGCRGRIDILCSDEKNNLVIIEVKIKASSKSVFQICKYPLFLQKVFPLYPGSFRKILCCLSSTKETKLLCKQNNIEYIELNSKAVLNNCSSNILGLNKNCRRIIYLLKESKIPLSEEQISERIGFTFLGEDLDFLASFIPMTYRGDNDEIFYKLPEKDVFVNLSKKELDFEQSYSFFCKIRNRQKEFYKLYGKQVTINPL